MMKIFRMPFDIRHHAAVLLGWQDLQTADRQKQDCLLNPAGRGGSSLFFFFGHAGSAAEDFLPVGGNSRPLSFMRNEAFSSIAAGTRHETVCILWTYTSLVKSILGQSWAGSRANHLGAFT